MTDKKKEKYNMPLAFVIEVKIAIRSLETIKYLDKMLYQKKIGSMTV